MSARVAALSCPGTTARTPGVIAHGSLEGKRMASRLRHRDRLLSLKYSTIEACFSVPMLNLTLPSFPFVLAFAVKGLGWQAGAVGWMASLPHFCNCLQPLLLAGLSRRFSNYRLLLLTFALG